MDLKLAKELLAQTNQYYKRNARPFSGSRQRRWPLLLSLLKYIKKGDRVLDLGCGNGRFYPLVRQQDAEYLGIDLSREMLLEARRMYPQAQFQQGDILDLPRYDSPFDLIIVIAVLHHLPHKKMRKQALRNICKNLKPGGCALITNWNFFQRRFWKGRWAQNLKKLFGQSKLSWNDVLFHGKRYYHGFKKKEIARLLVRAGFEIVENYYELEGKKVGRWRGKNLVTIARKKE